MKYPRLFLRLEILRAVSVLKLTTVVLHEVSQMQLRVLYISYNILTWYINFLLLKTQAEGSCSLENVF